MAVATADVKAIPGLEGQQARRRLLYGVNVAVSILLAVGLLVLAVYLAGRFRGRIDLTRSGANSLSPRTVKLLKGVEQPVTMTALYPVIITGDKLAEKRQRMVADLFALYESAAPGRITTKVIDPMKDAAETDAILSRLAEMPGYKEEAAPHEAALAAFNELNTQIADFLKNEATRMEAVPPDARAPKFELVEQNLRVLASEPAFTAEKIQSLLEDKIKQYNQIVQEIRRYLPRVQGFLQDAQNWMKSIVEKPQGLSEEALAFYRDAQARYAEILTKIQDQLNKTQDLDKKPIKLESVYNDLRRWASSPVILVESGGEARTLDLEEVWPRRTDQNAPLPEDGDDREFAGERALSSAVLQLTQKEKTAVVFVYWGGASPLKPDFSGMNPMMMREMPRAPYQQVNKYLQDQNFLTEEWNVEQVKTPPTVEGAARTVYVVLRPEKPQQNMMQMQQPPPGISPADKQAIIDAVNAGGKAVFLAGWAAPKNMMDMISGGGEYDYADYLKNTWGVTTKSKMLTVVFQPNPEKSNLWVPMRGATTLGNPDHVRFTDHEIGKPLEAVPTAFPEASPLEIAKGDQLPAGVKAHPVAVVAPSRDIWAIGNLQQVETDLRQRQGTSPKPEDLLAYPEGFPVAVACENDKGQRCVVFGSEQVATDQISFARTLMATSSGLVLGNPFPGNLDLLLNTLHWLTGDADRIAVGPVSSDVPRLTDLKEGTQAAFVRVFLVGIWPALALIAGGGVWLFRRR